MSFVFWAALAITGLVVGPVIAHLLRRGRAKEQEFPPVVLVPPLTSTARQRSHLEDYPLLVLRAAMIVALAVLGATPLVRCDRLSLSRERGASVALAIVLDDSLSMRAVSPKNAPRWSLAKSGAKELLDGARDGDAVAIVLAGKPARVALAATSDLAAARRALDDLGPSDRSTDLSGAIDLARAAVRPLPQKDQRVIVLSDLAGEPLPEGTPAVSAPLVDLARPVPDCGITSAELRGRRATVSVACSSDAAAEGRRIEIVVTERAASSPRAEDAGMPAGNVGAVAGQVELSHRSGEQTLSLDVPFRAGALEARLTGSDASRHDDTAPLSEEASLPLVAVVADPASASAKTGGPTLIEQALVALGDAWGVRPLPLLPDDEKGLESFAALVLDDPRGFSPETRIALSRFLARGGVAVALVGPRAAATELGLSLEPFGREAIRWEPIASVSIAGSSMAWLGPEALSLGDLAERGRARLDGTELPGTRVLGKWDDGVPLATERGVGRGLCVTVGLPASLDQSDFSLRPAFLALLDHALKQADQRNGSRRTVAGTPWVFAETEKIEIEGPEGRIPVHAARNEQGCPDPSSTCSDKVVVALPAVRGRYTLRLDGRTETRTVTVDPTEIIAAPRPVKTGGPFSRGAAQTPIDATSDVASILVALFGAELALRGVRRWSERRPSTGSVGPVGSTKDDPVPGA